MIKIGLDLHGVIDKDPHFFSNLSIKMMNEDNEVYVITGQENTEKLHKELKNYGIKFTKVLSITSYNKKIGIPVRYLNGDPTQPMMDESVWNATKSVLCFINKIDIMIDDSLIYGKYFKKIDTQYIVYNKQVREFLKMLFYPKEMIE